MNRTMLSLAGAILSFACAGALAYIHGATIRNIEEEILPRASELPRLEERKRLLREQLDMVEVSRTIEGGSVDEQINTFILPKDIPLPRIMAFFDILRETLLRSGKLRSMSAVSVGAQEHRAGFRAMPLRVTLEVSGEGLATVLSLLDLSGRLTVADALSEEDIQRFLARIETHGPTGMPAIEQFLRTPLQAYARESHGVENRLLRAFSDDSMESTLRRIVDASRLATAKSVLAAAEGQALVSERLWPIPFLTIEEVFETTRADGWSQLEVGMMAYGRE